MPNNKNKKTVSPLIIQKSRIQSVPNDSSIFSSETNSNDDWKTQNHHKRQYSPNQSPKVTKQFVTPNRFSLFSPPNLDDQNNDSSETKDNDPNGDILEHSESKPPPPIFINLVNDFKSFCSQIKSLTKGEPFTCKSSTNGVKLLTTSPNSYREVIKYLKSNKADYHTYQPKQDRAYRIVIRNLHHTTPLDDIKKELLDLGHIARNVTNVLQYNTKVPLPLFFIDLEPAINNKDIFKIEYLCYTKIKTEEPRVKRHLVQCLRCQEYGHTKAYCNHTPKCVRCGELHLSDSCQKPTDQPAKCALCQGNHPANYRGCPKHKEIQSSRNPKKTQSTSHSQQNNTNYVQPIYVNTTSNSNSQPKSYAQATKDPNITPHTPNGDNSDQISLKLISFLEDFKSLINPLISLLTTVITKLLSQSNAN